MKRVLIIEDEVGIRESLCDLLTFAGYEIVQAADGQEGIRLAQEESIDFILCDVNMPNLNGYEVLKKLKETDLLTFVPFIFLTAKSTMEELRKGMDLGADDYLTKPFSYHSLINAIHSAEKKKSSLRIKFSTLEEKLNEKNTILHDAKTINSHEVRGSLSRMQGIIPRIKSGDLPITQGLDLLQSTNQDIDKATRHLNELTENTQPQELQKKKIKNETKSIWLIDDDVTQNWVSKILLQEINNEWDIKEFNKAQKALELIEQEPPSIIFLDINMPVLDGFQFLDKVSQFVLDTQVIMLSSSVSSEDLEKANTYKQVIDYWVKPLNEEKIRNFFDH